MYRVAGQPVARRQVLAAAGTVALAATSLAADSGSLDGSADAHQAGIATPPLPFVSLAGFDVVTRNRAGMVQLLRCLTRTVAMLGRERRGVAFASGARD